METTQQKPTKKYLNIIFNDNFKIPVPVYKPSQAFQYFQASKWLFNDTIKEVIYHDPATNFTCDLNVSLETLHDMISECKRRDNNIPLGN